MVANAEKPITQKQMTVTMGRWGSVRERIRPKTAARRLTTPHMSRCVL
jgi:hypothetical protein